MTCLLTNRYDIFTQPQEPDQRMSETMWAEMQGIVQWANLSLDAIHGILVYLVIRGSGKIKTLVQQLPLGPATTSEDAVLFMMDKLSVFLPSSQSVTEESRKLVKFLLLVQ